MISRDKITEIFCMADDFCKLYDRFIKANGLAPKRDKSKRMYHRYKTHLYFFGGALYCAIFPLRKAY